MSTPAETDDRTDEVDSGAALDLLLTDAAPGPVRRFAPTGSALHRDFLEPAALVNPPGNEKSNFPVSTSLGGGGLQTLGPAPGTYVHDH